jgi:hypothetical protein
MDSALSGKVAVITGLDASGHRRSDRARRRGCEDRLVGRPIVQRFPDYQVAARADRHHSRRPREEGTESEVIFAVSKEEDVAALVRPPSSASGVST